MAWSKKPDFTADELRQMVEYNPETGDFTWRRSSLFSQRRNLQWGGKIAGSVEAQGYVILVIKGRNYKGHLLAWYYMTGEWPEHQVDHEDTVRSNNAWGNLRAATNQMNQFNKGPNKNNASGFKGVFKATNPARAKPWMAKISKGGESFHLGYFDTAEAAQAAYLAKAQQLAGEFARARSA